MNNRSSRAMRLREIEAQLIEERRDLRARLAPAWSLIGNKPGKDRRRHNQPIAIDTRNVEAFIYRGVILQRLCRVDEALKQLKEGTYGHCRNCRARIGSNRLEINPVVTLCHSCEAAIARR